MKQLRAQFEKDLATEKNIQKISLVQQENK